METIQTDILIIGGGGAALRAAVEAGTSGLQVDLVCKQDAGDSGTSRPSLHGFASTYNEKDTPESYFADWTRVGGHICDENLVWAVIKQSRRAVDGMEEVGLQFKKNPDGSRWFYQGAGQSIARGQTVTSMSDGLPNGTRLLRKTAENRGVRFHDGVMITRLLQQGKQVVGAVGVSRDKTIRVFSAKAVILAAGGANRLFPCVPATLVKRQYGTTGDSFALAYHAGAPIIDVEFTQFRDSPPMGRYGKYYNKLGERFILKYDPVRMENTARHTIVGAVYRELVGGRGPVICEVPAEAEGGPRKQEIGLDFQRNLGGTRINEKAESVLPGLFAAGESAGGIQGADRMQGDGFVETQAMGEIAAHNAVAFAKNSQRKELDQDQINKEQARIAAIGGKADPFKVITDLQQVMWENIGVVRTGAGLREGIARFAELRKQIPDLSGDDAFAALEADNLLLAAEMIARAALMREETRGTHQRDDFTQTDDKNWRKHVCITKVGGAMTFSTVPVATR